MAGPQFGILGNQLSIKFPPLKNLTQKNRAGNTVDIDAHTLNVPTDLNTTQIITNKLNKLILQQK